MAKGMVGALFATLGLDTAVFQQGLDDADRQAKGFAAGVGPIGNLLKTGLAAGFAAAGAAAVAAGAYFLKSGMDALQTADDVGDAAARLGVTAEAFQKLEIAATSAGAAPGLMGEALDKLNVGLGAFIQTGGGPAAEAFKQLGLSGRIASGQIATADQAFYEAARALESVESPAEKARLSMQMFGRAAGADMLEVLAPGADALIGYGDAAARSGRIMSDEMVAKLADAKLTIDNTKLAFGQMAQVLAGEAIVASMGFLDSLDPMIQQGKALAAQIGEFLGPAFHEMAGAVSSLMSGPFGQALVATLRLVGQVVGTVVVVALRLMIEELTIVFRSIDTVARGIADFITNLTAGFRTLAETAPALVQRMVAGVTDWLQGRLFAVLRGVIDRVRQVSEAFFKLYDAVVGHSYIPDMVEEIGQWIAKLQGNMVSPVEGMTSQTAAAFDGMSSNINSTLASLFKSIGSKDWKGALGSLFALGGSAGGGRFSKYADVGTSLLTAFGGGLPGFKTGGSFTVGGTGGVDSSLVAFRATPGEMVDVRRPGQDLGAGSQTIRVVPSPYFDVQVEKVAAPGAAQAGIASYQAGEAQRQRAGRIAPYSRSR